MYEHLLCMFEWYEIYSKILNDVKQCINVKTESVC